MLAAVLLATAVGGCAIEHQLVLDSSTAESTATAAPVSAAPTTPVSSSALPPPPGATESAAPPASPPLTPPLDQPQAMAPAAAPAAPADEPPRVAPGAQAGGLGGPWTLSANGQSCSLTLQEPPSSRAGWVQGATACGGFAEAASWTLSGSQLLIYDRNTRPLAHLTAAGPSRFEGTTTQGAAISLVR
ncbi:Protease inhibitor Inh [Blastochloris viridis]|uniref:Protease inhibitor Inh n=1 Tax=Blastochloris viridis TaxID=1079 RepID=A0A0S4Q105_BLAVI|nr:Protease inhibitor Inh [Blastochloris viridis]